MDNRGERRPWQFWRQRESERERRDARTAAIPGPWTSATPEHALAQRPGYCLRRIDSGQHLWPGDDRRIRYIQLQDQRHGLGRTRQEPRYDPVAYGRL